LLFLRRSGLIYCILWVVAAIIIKCVYLIKFKVLAGVFDTFYTYFFISFIAIPVVLVISVTVDAITAVMVHVYTST